MSESLLSQLMKVNLFYSNYKLRFNNHAKLQTNLGLFFTTCLIGLCLSLIITNGSILVNRKKQNINVNTITLNKQELFNITEKTLMFSYYMNFPRNVLLNESIMSIEIGNFRVQKSSDGGLYTNLYFIPLEWEFCGENYSHYMSKFNYLHNNTDYLLKNSFENHMCIKNSDNITMGGEFASEFFSNIYIKVFKCVSSKAKLKNITCASEDEYEKLFNGQFLNMFQTDAYIDTTDYDNPIKYKLTNYYNLLDFKIRNFINIYNKFTNIKTDIGIIFEENTYLDVINIDRIEQLVGSVNQNEGSIFELYINSSTNKTVITRSYMKFQELAAFIGGFIKIYMLIAEIICGYFYGKMELYDMINAFYNVNYSPNNHYSEIFTSKKLEKPQIQLSTNKTILNKKNNHNHNVDFRVSKFMSHSPKTSKINHSENENSISNQNIINNIVSKIHSNTEEKVFGDLNFSYFQVLKLDTLFCLERNKKIRNGLNALMKNLDNVIDLTTQVKSAIVVDRLCDVLLNPNQSCVLKSNLKFRHEFPTNVIYKVIDNKSTGQVSNSLSAMIDEGGAINNKIIKIVDGIV